MRTSKPIIILEGPDGGGKSTLAHHLAEVFDARVVHFGPMKHVTNTLPRAYTEGMLPALLGYQAVILDRSWLSEEPYGQAFRKGNSRLRAEDVRMLERVSLRSNTIVVNCRPPWEAVEASFKERKKEEYLDDEVQLRQVYDWYRFRLGKATILPCISYDYTRDRVDSLIVSISAFLSGFPVHAATQPTAGNLVGRYLIVGENFADHKENDPLQQYPFVSYSDMGCSRWLTQRLSRIGVNESQLLWANMDADLHWLINQMGVYGQPESAVFLGQKAAKSWTKFVEQKVNRVTMIDHPSYWRRFHASETEGYEGILNLALKGG